MDSTFRIKNLAQALAELCGGNSRSYKIDQLIEKMVATLATELDNYQKEQTTPKNDTSDYPYEPE